MNIYIYDDKKGKTEIIEIEEIRFSDNPDLEFFNDNDIRKVWHSGEEEWYLSIVDVVRFLTDSKDPKQYIKKMRQRDEELSSKWGTICTPLQMLAPDGKMRKTQAANVEGILRIIQSISSPKAEPFKIWLAKVGAERLDEIADPEKAMQKQSLPDNPRINSSISVALEIKKPKSWLKSVSAFANGIGGTLLFGIDDNRNVVGLTDAQADAEAISRLIKERISPYHIPTSFLCRNKRMVKIF